MSIEEVIQVNISRETSAVSQAGFGTGMFLDAHKRFTNRVLEISSASELLDAGFLSTDNAYKAALSYFGQELKPTKLAIGRRDSDDIATLTFDAPTVGKVYSITVNDEVLSFTATASETTAAEVAAAFELANTAGFTSAAITFDDTAADGTATITPTVPGTDYTVKSELNIEVAFTFSETLSDAFTAVKNENADFYFVMCYSHLKSDVLEMAAVVEAESKLFFTSNSEAEAYNTTDATDSTSTLKALKDAGYNRTACLYSAVADSVYPEAAQVGGSAPRAPGSITWAFKSLAGVTVDSLSAGEISNVKNKNGNVYTNLTASGSPAVRDGKVVSGEFIDIMRGVDWLEARLSERILSLQLNSAKIPYTDNGLALIEAEIAAQRQDGINAGLLAGSEEDTIFIPKVRDISFNDKANRVLRGVTFEFILAGAVHLTIINGTVTL